MNFLSMTRFAVLAAAFTIPAVASASQGPPSCTPGTTLKQITVETCFPGDCTTTELLNWFQALHIPKFDAALGDLVIVRLDVDGAVEGTLCYDNPSNSCCLSFGFELTTEFNLTPGNNVPALSLAPLSLDLNLARSGIVLGPSDGVLDCFTGQTGPPPDGTCTGGDSDVEVISEALVAPTVHISDPLHLQQWILGTGNAFVELSANANGLIVWNGCLSLTTVSAITARIRVRVRYEYCAAPAPISFCFGDGSGNACPCGNAGQAGAGCANSPGLGSVLVAGGSQDVGADDLVLLATGLPPAQPALLFSGTNALNGGAGVPFADGLRCAGGFVVRLGVRAADVNGATNWGPGLASTGGWQPGDVRRLQTWYRDPVGSPCGNESNLTNGLELAFH